MPFNSIQYLAFLGAVALCWWYLPRPAGRVALLGASYAFFASFGLAPLLLLLADTLVVYLAALVVATGDGRRRDVASVIGVLLPAAVLVLMKVLIPDEGLARVVVAAPSVDVAGLAVRIGASFFTFHAISYVVDVRRGRIAAQRDLLDVALYLAFFPHLVAGPIQRAGRLMPAFRSVRGVPDRAQLATAAELLFIGIFVKTVLADSLTDLVARGIEGVDRMSWSSALMLVSIVPLMAYANIFGYVYIVRGSARLLGIDMPVHTQQPFTRSRSMTEFWRRFQITVMAWFRDYVYTPIRGARRSAGREYLGLVVTFVGVGVWHGLTWVWVLWGLWHSGILIVERVLQHRAATRRRVAPAAAAAPRPPSWLRSFGQRAYVWYALAISSAFILTPPGGWDAILRAITSLRAGPVDGQLLSFGVLGLGVLVVLDRRDRQLNEHGGRPPGVTVLGALTYAAMLVALVIFSGSGANPIIYGAY